MREKENSDILDSVGSAILAFDIRYVAVVCVILSIIFSLVLWHRHRSWPKAEKILPLIIALVGIYSALLISAAFFLKKPIRIEHQGNSGFLVEISDETTLITVGLVSSAYLLIVSWRSIVNFFSMTTNAGHEPSASGEAPEKP